MKTVKSSSLFLLMSVLLFPLIVLAQEPTDRPFPAAQATSTDRPFPVAKATATESSSAVPTSESTENPDANGVNTEITPQLLLADVQATANAAQAQITQLEAERVSLLADLEASQTDNGATIFALVIIVIGMLLALAVFFGLRRSGT